MPFLFRMPKVQLSILLLFIVLSALKVYPTFRTVNIILISLGFTIFFDLLFIFLRKRKLFIPYAAIVTGLIIGLIIDPEAAWYQIATVSLIAMGTKNFLRISGKHIFNPAAVGLIIGGIIFKQYVSWWGVSFQNIAQFNYQNMVLFLILLLPILVSGFRMRRFYSILTFLIAFTIFSHIGTFTFSITSFLSRLIDPTTIFFAIVMLPEPITSPVNPKRQILFGLTVALVFQLISYPAVNTILKTFVLIPDLFIPALLIGNLIFFWYR